MLQVLKTDRITKWLVRLIGVALFLLVCSAGIAYIPFELWTHGNVDHGIAWLLEFYQRGDFGIPTLIWYVLALLSVWLGWYFTREFTGELSRILFRVSVVAFLLPPGIFIDPAPHFVGAIVHPKVYAAPDTEFLILPAIVCTMKYIISTPSSNWREVVIALSFWPIPMVWFITLLATTMYRLWSIELNR